MNFTPNLDEAPVFASLFHRRGWMTDAEWDAYKAVYDEVIRSVPVPALIVFCACDPKVCRKRLAHRDRPFDRKLPAAQVSLLHERYSSWLTAFDRCPVYEIDTTQFDPTDRAVAAEIAREIKAVLGSTVRPSLRLGALRRRSGET
jgi:deoxyadenosine/deoxycytidine kinase